ncbi:hypothetical protein [Lentzea sp. NPDC051838]|uniref:hypothetical protein n=1 Tax=Lentzea sp. NPDC051838 TaxID=3154849 RepID=UPI00343D04C9
MTNPVSDPQQPADTAVQPEVAPEITPAGPTFEVYTPPAFVPPQQQPVVEAPVAPKRKKTGVVVVSVLLVLLFGAAGAFGVLLVQEKDHSAELSKQVEVKDREISDLTRKVKESKDDATRAVDLQKVAEAAQKKAESDASSSQKCRDAARELRAAAIAQDINRVDAAGRDIFIHC